MGLRDQVGAMYKTALISCSLDVVRHWFNLMESNGWIPREQILGDEARSRVCLLTIRIVYIPKL